MIDLDFGKENLQAFDCILGHDRDLYCRNLIVFSLGETGFSRGHRLRCFVQLALFAHTLHLQCRACSREGVTLAHAHSTLQHDADCRASSERRSVRAPVLPPRWGGCRCADAGGRPRPPRPACAAPARLPGRCEDARHPRNTRHLLRVHEVVPSGSGPAEFARPQV